MSVAENFDLVIGERSLFFPHNEKSVKLFDSLVQGVIMGNVKLPLRRAAKKPWLTSPVKWPQVAVQGLLMYMQRYSWLASIK